MRSLQVILSIIAAIIVSYTLLTTEIPHIDLNISTNTTIYPTTTERHLNNPRTRIEVLKSPTSPLSPSLIHIQILSPRTSRKYQYSVIIQSHNTYTGVATLLSEPNDVRPFPPLLFEWSPIVEGEYEILIHEVPIENEEHTEVLPMDRLEVVVERQNGHFSMDERMNSPPCWTVDRMDAYSVWEGDWFGPNLINNTNDMLRSGWMFLPSTSMNCTIPSYTQHDLLNVPTETSIYVFGTSRERGVFLSLLDILSSPYEKEYLNISVVGKCWGRAVVQKGNFKLLYQDFRVINFEGVGSTRKIECHNDKVAKSGDALFIENALKVWDELFEVKEKWPSVVYMLTNDGPNYDFDYHTKSFVSKLPPTWNGTLVFSDFSFTAHHPNMEPIQKHHAYRSDIQEKLNKLNDTRIRWLDGMGIAKEMRLHGEWGEKHMAQSQHFHHFCNETYVDGNSEVKVMSVCSNITEMVANILLGHALGPKEAFMKTTADQYNFVESGIDTILRYCHSCPKRLLPFHITPYPDMTCERGPFHERTDTFELAVVCPSQKSVDEVEFCPQSCMKQDVSWQFDSQSDIVDVRECSVRTQTVDTVPDDVAIGEPVKQSATADNDKSHPFPLWLRSNLVDVSKDKNCTASDVPFYWQIPESGGTTIQNMYWCMGLTIANELGANPKFGHDEETSLVKLLPFHGLEWPVVNVDTSSKEGILRAKDLGLASSTKPSVDLVVSSHLRFAAKELFDPMHKGKVFTIFRHPVSREMHQNRHESTVNATIDNWMVRNLVGKEDPSEQLTDKDLEIAKEIVRTKIMVGLESRFVKSFDRFNAYLGIKIHKRSTRGGCIREHIRKKGVGVSQLPVVIDEEQKAIAEKNSLDVLLYEYAEGLFNEYDALSGINAKESS